MSDFHIEQVSQPGGGAAIQPSTNCVIRVLGIGGCGGNTLQHMINESLSGVEFITINTDSKALASSSAPVKVQIGVKLTGGLGAGCDPNKGRKAAEESREDIKKLLQGSDMVFITAGMGGGTGTGAAPIIAEIAKETGALTVAVVTKPFKFEGKRHMVNAESGITELGKHVDSLIVIDNDKLLKNLGANISIVNAFNEANDVLLNAVRGITDSITQPAIINLDFADVQTVMRGRGHAMIGSGVGQGANFVEDAVERAIHSPLIEQAVISSAAGLLVNARVNPNFPIQKWEEVCNAVQSYADEEADCKFGLSFDESLNEDQIAVTILITGISSSDPAARPKDFYNDPPHLTKQQEYSAPNNNPYPQPREIQKPQVEQLDITNNGLPSSPMGAFAMPKSGSAKPFTESPEVRVPGSSKLSGVDDDMFDLPPILRNKSL